MEESKKMKILDTDIVDNVNSSYIEKSSIHGYGLFAKEQIHKNTILGILDGQVISWENYNALQRQLNNVIEKPYTTQYFFREWNALDKDTLLVRMLRTKYSFINHSRVPNLKLIKYPLQIVAIKKIEANEEFTLDYRKEELNPEYLSQHGSTYL